MDLLLRSVGTRSSASQTSSKERRSVVSFPRHCALWLVFSCLLPFTVVPASAQASKEYQLKAVFLWRLAQFVDWPANAFESADSSIVIGVLGENPFDDALDVAVRGETAHGRKLVVQHYRRVDGIKTCHILFISESEARRVKEIIRALAGRSILTVSDIDDFGGASGGMIRFMTEQNKIKLRINLNAATVERLVFDARLLRAAEIVGTK